MDWAAGAETRFAAVFNALFVAASFWCFAGAAKYIPLASLASVLFVIGYEIIDWTYLRQVICAHRSDAVVCVATIIATLVAPLESAVFIGIALTISLYLRTASKLHISELVHGPEQNGTFVERPFSERERGLRRIIFLQLEGDLFFGVADELRDQLLPLANESDRVVIFRMKRTHSIDATVLQVLERFSRDMKKRGGQLIFCGVRPELMRIFNDSGLAGLIGPENLFATGDGLFSSAKCALARAQQLSGSSREASAILSKPQETWIYQI